MEQNLCEKAVYDKNKLYCLKRPNEFCACSKWSKSEHRYVHTQAVKTCKINLKRC